jgi:hypothetical protein
MCHCCHCQSKIIWRHWSIGLWWQIIIPKHLARDGGKRLDGGWGGRDFAGIG